MFASTQTEIRPKESGYYEIPRGQSRLRHSSLFLIILRVDVFNVQSDEFTSQNRKNVLIY